MKRTLRLGMCLVIAGLLSAVLLGAGSVGTRDGVFIHAPGSGKKVRRESLASGYFRARFSGARAYL